MLRCDDLFVESEDQAYEAALAWIRFNLRDRRQYVAELMSTIRFPTMHIAYLAAHVQNEPLLKDNPECMDYILGDQPSTGGHQSQIPRLSVQRYLMVIGGGDKSTFLYNLWDGQRHQVADAPRIHNG